VCKQIDITVKVLHIGVSALPALLLNVCWLLHSKSIGKGLSIGSCTFPALEWLSGVCLHYDGPKQRMYNHPALVKLHIARAVGSASARRLLLPI
jgi:hypothetical protein